MKQIYPNYYDHFTCIADKCKHNCCIGWEIDIDDDTMDIYDSIGGEFGNISIAFGEFPIMVGKHNRKNHKRIGMTIFLLWPHLFQYNRRSRLHSLQIY